MAYESEIYIVDVTRDRLFPAEDERSEDEILLIQVRRNDGYWYDEDYTLIATTDDPGDVGGIIAEDWAEREQIDHETKMRLRKS